MLLNMRMIKEVIAPEQGMRYFKGKKCKVEPNKQQRRAAVSWKADEEVKSTP